MRRRRLTILLLVLAGSLAIGVVAWQRSDRRDNSTSEATGGLPTRIVEVGEVTVEIEPQRLDATGAEFTITFDTHSVDLGFDVAAKATLVVAGVRWTQPRWTGDGPGGHHRSGTLRFANGGPPTGPVELRIDGLAEEAVVSWTVTD